MARALIAGCLFAALAPSAVCREPMGWPTRTVRHRYFDTPNGQLHYVVGPGAGAVQRNPTLVLLHSHPRSTAEFKYFARDMGGRFPFLAVDYFGMGLSEDYQGANASDTFCTYPLYAKYILDILTAERIQDFALVGNLKGTTPSIEVAAQAGRGRVKAVVLINLIVLSAKAKDYIEHVFIPSEQKAQPHVDGSHLMAAWNDPSSAAFGPDGKPSAEPKDLFANEEKVVDELRCLYSGWQASAAWAAYNDMYPNRISAVDSIVPILTIFGQFALDDMKKYGLDPEHTFEVLDHTLTHGHNVTVTMTAGEGMIIQNSTLLAHAIGDFVEHRAVPLVV